MNYFEKRGLERINGTVIQKFKADNKNVNFPIQLCQGNISNKFDAVESRAVCLKGNVYDFSDYNAIYKSEILTIH